tara:strand:- start:1112 stop:1315 length:204 start_codon:yes stop_codon:yes gene_type:complete
MEERKEANETNKVWINDSGIIAKHGIAQKVYAVITKRPGRVQHSERFDTMKEAENWIKWTCSDLERV